MQLEDRTTSLISSFSMTECTVYGLAVAVRPKIVGFLHLYLTMLRMMSPSVRKEVLKL